ncbi:MAG: glycoside hydrolase family 5 protein [Polyangiaceae bacterium]
MLDMKMKPLRKHHKRYHIRACLLMALFGAYAGCSSDTARDSSVEVAGQRLFSTIPYRGVNLAVAEFTTDPWGNGSFPGTYNVDYVYPSVSEADYFIAKGMNTFRVPFRWERLQRTLNGSFDATELQRLTDTVNGLTAKGASVIVDPHNYGRYLKDVVGSSTVPNSSFADFWTRLANVFKSNSKVILAVMNEPHDMPSTEGWVTSANAAIAAIRATGATNLILVQGNGWSGAHSWNQTWYGTANSVAMLNITDPGNNYAFEVHQYLDSNFSGETGNCVSATIGSEKLQNFTDWLTAHNYKGFVSEFGGGRNATCYAAISDLLNHMKQNSGVYLGWTYWAAGPWWGEYELTLEPTNGQDRPQMAYIAPYLTNGTGGSGGSGGSSATGGSSALGGSSSSGGTSAIGGSSSTGGTSSIGGSSAVGGSSARGGSSSTGGTSSIRRFLRRWRLFRTRRLIFDRWFLFNWRHVGDGRLLRR